MTDIPNTEEVHGILSCVNCGSLLCVQIKKRDIGQKITVTREITEALQPRPAQDIAKVVCAGCSEILWEDEPNGAQ